MKWKFSLVEWSVERPWWVVLGMIVVTVAFLTQFPKVRTDTNPKHMLPATSAVRVWNDEVDRTFGLYEDMIVLGIVNERGILNEGTLEKVQTITREILKLEGVAARDVSSLTTIDNVTAENGMLTVRPVMEAVPRSRQELETLRKDLFDNPLLMNRVISRDEMTTAIYIPLEKGANAKLVADRIRDLVSEQSGSEEYFIAGDPVARDTFGAEMFTLMAVFSPIAGAVMLAVRYMMFGDFFLSITLMMDGIISIVWSMGLLIALGFPIHIMASMGPVFLMAIATDSIHIFNEFYFRYKERQDKKAAILETMAVVAGPVRYTALATAAGFAVLLFMNIVPVRVFGGLVAFGTVTLRILSFSFIPAMFTFVKEKNVARASRREDIATSRTSFFLKSLAGLGAHRPGTVVLVGLLLLTMALLGMTKIVVNNNMVDWFKKYSDIRVADRVLNRALGGTSLAYIVASAAEEGFMQSPEALRYLEALQRHLEKLPAVGKTTSVADYVKRINRVLHQDDPRYETVPNSKETIGQYLFLFSMSAKPSDLDSVVDYPFKKANIWVQLKSWDAQAMRDVIRAVEEYTATHPTAMIFKPAGIAYFNLVWNDEVLWDMVKGFLLSLLVVFMILATNCRSVRWAIVGFAPLLFTICLVYGVIGFVGKDFDMPIAVLSCLSLGMAVDFPTHFLCRLKQRLAEIGSPLPRDSVLVEALLWTAARPGKGILRNALLFASTFSVMLFASLTPYITVGAFIVSMMTLSALMTILYLPALIVLLRRWLFAEGSGPLPGTR